MDARRIGNELSTGFVTTSSSTDVTGDVLRIVSQFPDFHEGIIWLGFILDPQLDESPVEFLWLLAYRTHVGRARKNGDVGLPRIRRAR